eukprot:jgi/Chrzof1/13527/Cz08g00320.t1
MADSPGKEPTKPDLSPVPEQDLEANYNESQPLLQAISRPSDSVVININPPAASNCSDEAASEGSGRELRTCRICFEQEEESPEPDNPMISPCLCSGSSRYVHRKCLQQWRLTNHRSDAYYQCEVCKFKYQYRRLWWADLIGSKVTILLCFLLLVCSTCYVLGFVPVLRPFAASKGWQIHVLNGIAMMGILGLFLSIVIGTLRACGVHGIWFLPDPFCPGLACLDCPGGALGWGPIADCGGMAECGAAMLVIMLAVGFVLACYMIYGVLFMMVQRAVAQAQYMVENITAERTK